MEGLELLTIDCFPDCFSFGDGAIMLSCSNIFSAILFDLGGMVSIDLMSTSSFCDSGRTD
jgi:hypothetical protein